MLSACEISDPGEAVALPFTAGWTIYWGLQGDLFPSQPESGEREISVELSGGELSPASDQTDGTGEGIAFRSACGLGVGPRTCWPRRWICVQANASDVCTACRGACVALCCASRSLLHPCTLWTGGDGSSVCVFVSMERFWFTSGLKTEFPCS